MNGLKLIKEEIFLAKDRPWIRKFFSHLTEKCFTSYKRGYAIYTEVNGETKPIKLSFIPCDLGIIGFKKSFVNHIKKHYPTNFKDILFLVDIYDYFNRVDFEKAISKFHHLNSTTNEVIHSILPDSKGIILWHHQLENLLNMFFINRNEVTSIRKGINAKKADTFKILKSCKIDDAMTLEAFIRERMILTYGRPQNIYGAHVLNEILKS